MCNDRVLLPADCAQASKQEEEMISTSFKARPVPDFLQVPR